MFEWIFYNHLAFIVSAIVISSSVFRSGYEKNLKVERSKKNCFNRGSNDYLASKCIAEKVALVRHAFEVLLSPTTIILVRPFTYCRAIF